MSESIHGSAPVKLKAALQVLKNLNIPFRRPFVTPQGNRIFLVGDADGILTAAEVVEFYEAGKLTPDAVSAVLGDLERIQRTRPHELESGRPPGTADRRRSPRVMLQLAVIIRAEMPDRKSVQTQAFTVVVNAHGGRLESALRMVGGQK